VRGRPARLLLVALVLVLVGVGCGVGGPGEPAAVRFTAVDLPAGAAPVVLSAAGDALLIGVRRDGQPVVPGLLRLRPVGDTPHPGPVGDTPHPGPVGDTPHPGSDGAVTEVAVHGASPYGVLATWRSIASDGDRMVAIGGERGGAHGHVRWCVWTGSAAGITEQVQGFSTFGGYEAGDLVDAVLTPVGPALIGSWASAKVGFDVAVWTADGETWTRQSSAGTALESDADTLGFPMAAAALQQGMLVAGWQLALDAGGRQQPVVWRSSSGNTGWATSRLPEAGKAGAAVAVRCWGSVCGVAGRVDGQLAVWRLADGGWVRIAGAPPIAVGDRDRLAAPIEIDGKLTQLVSDRGQVKIAVAGGDKWTVRAAAGPTGTVTAVTTVGDTIYLLAGPDENTQTLWRADLASIR